MNRLLAGVTTGALWSFAAIQVLHAQVLITAENGGKGTQSVMVTANAIQPKGSGTLTNFWVQYGYGLSDRIDTFLSYGDIVVLGRSQSYVGIGWNLGLLKSARTPLDVSLYNNVSIPINQRGQASCVLVSSALIGSRPFQVEGRAFTLYGGASRLTPIGSAVPAVFTPPSAVYNGIAGVAVAIGKVTLFSEYNPGAPRVAVALVSFTFFFATRPAWRKEEPWRPYPI